MTKTMTGRVVQRSNSGTYPIANAMVTFHSETGGSAAPPVLSGSDGHYTVDIGDEAFSAHCIAFGVPAATQTIPKGDQGNIPDLNVNLDLAVILSNQSNPESRSATAGQPLSIQLTTEAIKNKIASVQWTTIPSANVAQMDNFNATVTG